FLGVPGAADTRWAFRETLEPEEIHRHSAGGLVGMRDRLRPGSHLRRAALHAAAARSRGKRCFPRDAHSLVALVFARRACSRQCVMAAVPALRSDSVLAVFGVDARPLGLEEDACS